MHVENLFDGETVQERKQRIGLPVELGCSTVLRIAQLYDIDPELLTDILL